MAKLLPRTALRQLLADWLRDGLGQNPNLSELERATGITRQTIADIRDSKTDTSDENVRALANALKIETPEIRLAGRIHDPEGVAAALRELAMGLARLADRLSPEYSGDEAEFQSVPQPKATESPKPRRVTKGTGKRDAVGGVK